jgi:hypothetical protein
LQASALDAINHAGAIDDRKMLVSFQLACDTALCNDCLRHQAGTFALIHGQASFRQAW